MVDFSIDSRQIDHVSAIDLIDGRVAPAAIAGKTVIVGATAIELRDFFYVPVHGLVSGSVLQALGAESILQGRALRQTGDALALVALALVLAAASFVRVRWTTLIATVVLAAVGIEVLALVVEARVPLIVNTAPLQAGFAFLIAATVLEEINARARRIAYLARFDTLTGLANRNQFLERLRRAESNDHAVVALRLDRFDEVCETFGHGVGDRLLCAVGGRIATMLLPADCLARFGGDAFAVLVSGAGANARSKALARDLIARVGEPYVLGGHRLVAALSFGLAPMVRGRDADALLKQAETALHRAEASGGNALVSFDEAMVAGQSERQVLELELWEAFESSQFEVHYQPQVDLRDGTICGVEALVRWQHPQRGLISPDVFIPIAEAVGLIQPIGEWVLERACRDVARWPGALRLAVNVSPTQFARGDVVAAVKHALAVSGLPAERLDLEITEAVFIDDRGAVAAMIADLRGIGVGCALDDFGTGYSSLAYLRRFMIDKVKLDRSFVVGVPSNPDAVAIAQAVGMLAQSFGLRLNAEGIERHEQIACLRLLGFTEGQGFLFGRPMREAELLARLRTGNAAAPERSLAAG
jgi:diguanylate cyclase (GGDEF)-like protein